VTGPQLTLLFGFLLVLAACTPQPPDETFNETSQPVESAPGEEEALYPDVLDVEVTLNPDGTFRFSVTLSSPYDTPQRYADAWRIKGADGTVYGVRELVHDHANEQPFTRSLDGVEIPAEVTTVIVEGRDQVSGWGGETVEVTLPGRGR
jgi:hypothetical protein